MTRLSPDYQGPSQLCGSGIIVDSGLQEELSLLVSESSLDGSGAPVGRSNSGGFWGWRAPTARHFTVIIVLILLAVGIDLLVVNRNSTASSQVRQSGIPANVPTSLANLMALAPTPSISAPAFTLTDQNGKTLSLSSFKGHAVVLEFMDPNCTDICPLVSQEFVDAYHNLGSSASNVVFLAVNVNKYHLSTSAVEAFTNGHGLNKIPDWHFFTGNLSALQKIWSQYGITVDAPSPTADVVHTSIVYFIDARGRERYIASPTDYHTPQGTAYLPASQLTAWGHGIATVSGDLAK